MAALSAEFEDSLTTPQIEACINRIAHQANAAPAELTALFVKPQTPDAWRARCGAMADRTDQLVP